MRVNLELKHYCPDFRPIRRALVSLGAKKVGLRKQKDFFFNLPAQKSGTRPRMKFRIEDGKQELIYYVRPGFSRNSATHSKLLLYFPRDNKLLPFLRGALGVNAIVEKKREVWRLGEAVFHLDSIKGIGDVFEIELRKNRPVSTKDKKLFARYQKLVLPHLGSVIRGSNGDLLASK